MNLSSIDLNLLHTLHVVLEEQSVARAAARLHVTGPAVSNALARLRELLGDPLVVRRGRGLALTPRALELRPQLAGAMAAVAAALAGGAARFDPATTTRTFTLAASDADQVCSVPAVAARFRSELPAATLRVLSLDQFEAEGGFGGPSIDAAIGPREALAAGLRSAPLYDEEGVMVVRAGHPATRGPLTRARLGELRHVDIRLLLGRAGTGNRAARSFFAAESIERPIAAVVPTFSAAVMVAAATDLVAGLPRRLARLYESLGLVAILRLPVAPLRFHMHVLWPESTDADAGSTFFRRLIVEALRPAQAAPGRARRRAGAG